MGLDRASVEAELPCEKKRKLLDGAKVQVRIADKTQEHPSGTEVRDVLSHKGAVAARLDNLVVPLSQSIVGSDVALEHVTLNSADGVRVLVESLKFMLQIAKQECFPELAITIGRPIGAAYYVRMTKKETGEVHHPTDAELQKIQSHMSGLIDAALPFEYKLVSCKAAIDNLSKTGSGCTAKVLEDRQDAQVQVVECKGMYHLPRAATMPSTDAVPKDSFNLVSFKDGFLLEHLRFDSKSGEAKHNRYGAAASDMLYNEYMNRLKWTAAVELGTVGQLNGAIRDGNSKKVIQAVEANCDRQFVELAAKVDMRQDVKLLLIAGPSSSGKTTFAKRLQVQLEALGRKPVVLSVDSFYKGWPDITSEGASKVDWEALVSLNLVQLNDVLVALMEGKEALIPEYDMKTSMPMDKSHWSPMKLDEGGRGMIIMEGIHCLNPALTAAVPKEQKYNIAIAPIPALQLDANHVLSGTVIRMLRRTVRDYLTRGRPVLATLKQWPSIAAGEVNNIYPFQHNADAVMNSEIGYEMCVLKVHAEPLLKTVPSTAPEYSEVQRLLQTLEQFIALPTNIIPPQSLIREFVGGSWYYDYGGWYKSY